VKIHVERSFERVLTVEIIHRLDERYTIQDGRNDDPKEHDTHRVIQGLLLAGGLEGSRHSCNWDSESWEMECKSIAQVHKDICNSSIITERIGS